MGLSTIAWPISSHTCQRHVRAVSTCTLRMWEERSCRLCCQCSISSPAFPFGVLLHNLTARDIQGQSISPARCASFFRRDLRYGDSSITTLHTIFMKTFSARSRLVSPKVESAMVKTLEMGYRNVPKALIDMRDGRNFGKMLGRFED